MPEFLKRRDAVNYFRRVVPKDLWSAGYPRDICRSLHTRVFSEAKLRLHIEIVRFDEWVQAQRRELAQTRQTPVTTTQSIARLANDRSRRAVSRRPDFSMS